jgi:hypothetical protein
VPCLLDVVNTRQHESIVSVRALAEQAFSRAAGAPLVPENSIRLLKDARENYPAWLDALPALPNSSTSRATSFTKMPLESSSVML